MAHIHDLIDFTVAIFIVNADRVLFVHHKELGKWLPVGGHIELDENPDQALFREMQEETGLMPSDVSVLSDKPNFSTEFQKYLYTPNLLDIHKINDKHQHIGLFYFVKSNTDQVTLEEGYHHDIKWLSESDLDNEKFAIREDIVFAAKKAIGMARGQS